MGFRFRRSFGIIPGVRINVGRRGPSVSLGVRGAHVTVGPTGVRKSVGIPGTGMSYTTHEGWGEGRTARSASVETTAPPIAPAASGGGVSAGWIVAFVLFVILIAVLASR